MKIIVGLGNPGEKYEMTRHNAGFIFLDHLKNHKSLAPVGQTLEFKNDEKLSSEIVSTSVMGEKIILVKPQTYMNLSGEAVQKVLSYYKAEPSDLIVVSDDIDLPLGMARIRLFGSSGGHKGLQSIIDIVKTDQFKRVRIGINNINGDSSRAEKEESIIDTVNFVLEKFQKREELLLSETIDQSIEYILPYLRNKAEIEAHTINLKIESL